LESTIEISSNLWTRLVEVAQARGFSSPQQFVTQLIERELAREQNSSSSDAEITQKMEELGYLDFGRDI
jgi:predicted transcriptional regulator